MESKNSFLLYTEQKEIIDELSNEDAGELIKAIYAYAAGEEVNLRKDLHLVFIPIRQQIDRNNAKYDDFKKKQSENGKKGGRPVKNENPKNPKNPTLFLETQKSLNVNVNVNDNVNDNVNVNDNDNVLLFSNENNNRVDFLCGNEIEKISKVPRAPQKKFIKPSLKEISDYCKERNNDVNPERFLNYYEANGWKVGRNSMKDWKAAIRTWEGNCRSPAGKKNNEEIDGWSL